MDFSFVSPSKQAPPHPMDSKPYTEINSSVSPVTPMSRSEIQYMQTHAEKRREEKKQKEKEKKRLEMMEWMQTQKLQYKKQITEFVENRINMKQTECILDSLSAWPYEYWSNKKFLIQFLQEMRDFFPGCNVDFVFPNDTYENDIKVWYNEVLEVPFDMNLIHQKKGVQLRIQWD